MPRRAELGAYFDYWVDLQQGYLKEIDGSFSPTPIFHTVLQGGEPIGVEALSAIGHATFGECDPGAVLYNERPIWLEQWNDEGTPGVYELCLRLPFLAGETVDLTRDGTELGVTVGRIQRSIALPRILYDCTMGEHRYEDGVLRLAFREATQPGSGILYDLGAHLIDQAVVLFGMPQQLTAHVRRQRAGVQVDDYFHITLGYGTLTATLKASMLAREPGPHFTLHGTAGSFVKYGMDPQEDLLKAGATPGGPGWGLEPSACWGKLTTQIDDLHFEGQLESLPGRYQGFYENIYAALNGEAALSVTAAQARDTIRLIELAQQSSAEGRTLAVECTSTD